MFLNGHSYSGIEHNFPSIHNLLFGLSNTFLHEYQMAPNKHATIEPPMTPTANDHKEESPTNKNLFSSHSHLSWFKQKIG